MYLGISSHKTIRSNEQFDKSFVDVFDYKNIVPVENLPVYREIAIDI
ncbi:hypothetical protein SPJ1_0297 [Streptococcus parauberis KRS-02083]|uniref:Uncharacterized protein n=1 Tax=Streptococcus parauberis KRS-02083 TaxID=1207545 RepID=A0ABN0IU24_9STRE|nr:hypothetical protein SPJ1_0297 [Streptococcus parauberis KRS-02083]